MNKQLEAWLNNCEEKSRNTKEYFRDTNTLADDELLCANLTLVQIVREMTERTLILKEAYMNDFSDDEPAYLDAINWILRAAEKAVLEIIKEME